MLWLGKCQHHLRLASHHVQTQTVDLIPLHYIVWLSDGLRFRENDLPGTHHALITSCDKHLLRPFSL